MKTLKEYMSEETNPFALSNGFVGVEDEKARDNINALLNGITMKPFLTPYIALERVAKVLANYHIHLPKHTFEDIEGDSVSFEVNQFGEKAGMTNDGEVVSKMSDPYFIYFEYNQNEQGTYDVFCEIVDADDLEELMSGEEDDKEELDEGIIRGTAELIKHGVTVPAKAAGRAIGGTVNAIGAVAGGVRKTVDDIQTAAKQVKAAYAKKSPKKVLKLKKKEEQLDEIADTEKGRERLEKYAAKAHSQTGYKSKLTPKEKKRSEYSDKALAIVDKKSGKKTIRSSSPLYDYDEEVKLDEATEKRKELLKRYIKAASHDVAARSAAVRGFARDAEDERNSGKLWNARKSDERANKMFKKSWNRRQYMAKAVDKLTSEENLNEVGDTLAGKKAINRVALRGDAEIADQAYRKRPNKKALAKAERAVDLSIATHKRRGGNVLGGYLKHAYGIKEEQSADTHTGALTYKGKAVVSPTATKAEPAPEFKMPKKIPLPPTRDKNMASDSDIENIKKDLMKESNPAKEGMIAAGYKGSNPAEQGAIAVKKDDEARERKANFKVAKKLAKDAKKTAMKKAMEKKSSK